MFHSMWDYQVPHFAAGRNNNLLKKSVLNWPSILRTQGVVWIPKVMEFKSAAPLKAGFLSHVLTKNIRQVSSTAYQ